MKIKIVLVLLAACVALVQQASAQSDFYTADSYYSVTIAGDGTVYTSVTVEGQVNWDAPGGAEHTYTNYSTLNGTPMYQESDPTRDYVSLTNCQQTSNTPGQGVAFSYEESVDCNYMGEVYDCEEDYQFPVVFLTQEYNNGDPLLGSALFVSQYGAVVGQPVHLGPIISHGINAGCGVGYETIGMIDPSDFVGDVSMDRDILDQELYVNGSAVGGASPGPDGTPLQDSNPQDDPSSPGTVYDFDVPLLFRTDNNETDSYRTNFTMQAYLADTGMPVSAPIYFYVRMSCTYHSIGGWQLNTTITGDNQAGPGTTSLNYGL